MNAVTQFLYNVLAAINGVVNNYGVAIIIFTILMRLVCMPFDYRSRKGMRKMTLLQPKLNELQRKYGNDKQKFQQKQAELMRKEHYNPMSSCLPLLLTWPLMIAMFAAMRGIANEQLALQAFRYLAGDSAPIQVTEQFLWIKNIWMTDSPFTAIAPNAASLQLLTQDVWQRAYEALSEEQLLAITQSLASVPDAVLDFSSNDAMRASVASIVEALGHVQGYAAATQSIAGWENVSFLLLFSITLYQNFNGLLVLPILAGATQIIQMKFNPQMQQQNTVPQPETQNQNKGTGNFMKWFFPILSVYFCLSSNAGFALYWVTSNVVMFIQSFVITKILEKQDEKQANTVSGEGTIK